MKNSLTRRGFIRTEVLTGAQLRAWQAAIDTPAKSLLIVYKQKP